MLQRQNALLPGEIEVFLPQEATIEYDSDTESTCNSIEN